MNINNRISWKDITIEKFEEIQEILMEDPEDKEFEILDKKIMILSIITGKDADEYYSMSLNELTEEMQKLSFLDIPIEAEANSLAKNNKISNKIVIDGDEYVFSADMTKFTVSQYIDYQTYVGMDKNNMAEILSCFIKPKGSLYGKDYDVQALINLLRKRFSVVQAFFLIICYQQQLMKCNRDILISEWLRLRKIGMKMKGEEKKKIKEARRMLWKIIMGG